MAATWADVSKAGQLLGWEPQFNFEQGIDQTVRWYQAQRAWAKEISTE
jgi:nucleoside-diphosphate-sugar epimerase